MQFENLELEEVIGKLSDRTVQYFERKCPDFNPEELTPAQRMDFVKTALLIGMADQAKIVDEQLGLNIAELLESYFIKTLDEASNNDEYDVEASNVSGLIPLSALFTIMIGPLSRESFIKMLPTLIAYIVYFIVEKFSDDWGKLKGFIDFLYRDTVSKFDNNAHELILELKQLNNVIRETLNDEATVGISTEISELVARLDAKLPEPFREYYAKFLRNPNGYFLSLNHVSLSVLNRQLLKLYEKYPETSGIHILAEHAIYALDSRYSAMQSLVDDPGKPIEESHNFGQFTILTGTFKGMLAAAGDADPRVRAEIENNHRLIDKTINDFNIGIRGLNDTALTCVNLEFTFEQFEAIRKELGENLAPRELFMKLGELDKGFELSEYKINVLPILNFLKSPNAKMPNQVKKHSKAIIENLNFLNHLISNPEINTNINLQSNAITVINSFENLLNDLKNLCIEDCAQLYTVFGVLIKQLRQLRLRIWQNLFSRYIKDSKEGEYNLILSSGLTQEILDKGPEAVWSLFAHNLNFYSGIFSQAVKRFMENLVILAAKAPYTAEFLARKFLFNIELYVLLNGDYDRAGNWKNMWCMTVPNPVEVLIYIIENFNLSEPIEPEEAELNIA